MSRTGVFIAAMCEVERVKVEGEVDIFQTIKAMRKQRPHMVYNKVCPHSTPPPHTHTFGFLVLSLIGAWATPAVHLHFLMSYHSA